MQHNDISRNKDAPERRRFSFLPRGIFFLAVVALLSLLSVNPAHSEPEDSGAPGVNASTDPQTNNCAPGGANLSGTFATPPCMLTETSQGLTFALQYYGGEQVVNHLEDWWTKDFLPALKSMHKQLTGSLINQTLQFGTLLDAQNTTRAGNIQLKNELKNKLRDAPGDRSCVSGTALTGIAKANSASNAYAHGLTQDISKTSSNVKVSPTSSSPSTTTSTTVKKISPAEDQKIRWDQYCTEFNDPLANNGVSACPEPDPLGKDDPIINGDISIESLLLADTFYMDDPHESKAVGAILRNLVYPKMEEEVPDAAVDSFPGREAILKRQHLASVRNIATNVISSIISRRTSIPSEPSETEPDPDAKPEVVEGGSDNAQADAIAWARSYLPFKNDKGVWETPGPIIFSRNTKGDSMTYCQALGSLAAGGVAPMGQQGVPATDGGYTYKKFLGAGSAMKAWEKFKAKGLAHEGAQPSAPGDIVFFKSSSVHGHTGIFSGDNKYISVLRVANPAAKPSDSPPSFATTTMASVREEKMSYGGWPYLGYVTPLSNGAEIPPGSPLSVGELIQDIRRKAGVDDAEISADPSYNEIMQALTKERFLDPEYFVKVQGDVGAIKQEQTINNAYITIQYQDIYRMQEQINSLLAARASLKFNKDQKSSQTSSAPTTKPSN